MRDKEFKRIERHRRIRKRIIGRGDRPRLCVYRSLTGFYAQVVDDRTGKVLFGMSTRAKAVSGKIKRGGNIDAASVLGEAFAAGAREKGITRVCFDRGGYLYHGRVKAFAEAARKGGMEF